MPSAFSSGVPAGAAAASKAPPSEYLFRLRLIAENRLGEGKRARDE